MIKQNHNKALQDCHVNLRAHGISGMRNLQDSYIEIRNIIKEYLDAIDDGSFNDVDRKLKTLRDVLK